MSNMAIWIAKISLAISLYIYIYISLSLLFSLSLSTHFFLNLLGSCLVFCVIVFFCFVFVMALGHLCFWGAILFIFGMSVFMWFVEIDLTLSV